MKIFDLLTLNNKLKFGSNLGLTIGKYFIKIIFDIKTEIGIFEISNVPNFQILGIFNFGINLDPTGGKYFVKIIFNVKMEIGILEKEDAPNF